MSLAGGPWDLRSVGADPGRWPPNFAVGDCIIMTDCAPGDFGIELAVRGRDPSWMLFVRARCRLAGPAPTSGFSIISKSKEGALCVQVMVDSHCGKARGFWSEYVSVASHLPLGGGLSVLTVCHHMVGNQIPQQLANI